MAQQSGGGALLLVAALFAGFYLTRDSSLDQPAPGFSLPETYGSHVNLDSYRGHPLLLVFWSTSCGICRREMPMLSQMTPQLRRKGVEILAIQLGEGDNTNDYLRENHIDFKSAVDNEGAVAQAYHVGGIPKLVLIGRDGKIKRTKSGLAGPRTLLEWADSVTGT